MNIPMSWMKEYVNIDCNAKEFADKMTLSGSNVETIEYKNKELENIVVGKITSIEKHPDADKLVVCQVNIGEKSVQIVTGAQNVYEGAVIPVVLDGGVVSGNNKIKKGKLRGVESQGMMCSIEELGYTAQDYPEQEENGIYIFKEEVELGADVSEILQLKEDIVEFEITSNRPDCYSVFGLAREASATFDVDLKYPEMLKSNNTNSIDDILKVKIEAPDLCSRYVGKLVKNIKIETSPLWLRHRLTSAGIRPINNIVDITNYVMLEFGQPMHAFDFDDVVGGEIIVRRGLAGEKITTLDGEERNLDTDILVIADKEKPIAIAGIIGGENSKITENAKYVLFESASFNGTSVRLSSKKLGLRTDASGKFEKGLDPNLSLLALNRALYLVELLGAGEVVDGIVDEYVAKVDTYEVAYSPEKINKFLGTNISSDDMIKYLSRLEIKSNGSVATIPTFRYDIETWADISEEIARIYGYDKIETTLATGSATVGKFNKEQLIDNIIITNLVAQGLSEAMTYSFESPKVFEKLNLKENNKLRNVIKILNPLGEDFSIMRTSTVNGMLNSLSNNISRRTEEIGLFEIGGIYLANELPLKDMPKEEKVLTIGMYGNTDFYNLKGIVDELFKSVGILDKVTYTPESEIEYMHPGRCANIMYDGEKIGQIGEVHPVVANNYSITKRSYIGEINITKIYDIAILERVYKPLPKFPASKRDIAMLVKDDVLVMDIENAIKEKGGKILESIQLFDIYKGDQIEEGYKSIAYNLVFRDSEKTLTDSEINEVMERILKNLKNKVSAELRK